MQHHASPVIARSVYTARQVSDFVKGETRGQKDLPECRWVVSGEALD